MHLFSQGVFPALYLYCKHPKNHFATVSEQHVFNHTKAFLPIKTFTPTISLKTCMG